MTRYDHVIVGAGSAGCVLAHRLSEDPTCRVLVVEAGGEDRDKHVKIPAAFTKLFKTAVDWNFHTAPEAAMGRREMYWPRAKMLGGCSSMNAQMYVRGNAADYDLWEDLGNPGWSFRSVLPYFRRAESYARPTAGLHGTSGLLHVSELRDPNPTTSLFLEAASQVGIARIADVNGASQDGAAPARVNQWRGRRWSAADAYLRPAMRRPNLTVMTGAHLHRIIFEGRRAVGVEVEQRGRVSTIAAGEVVLAAGAIGSPHLLMLSGVGPADVLREHGIPIVHALAGVGRDLQDHLVVTTIVECLRPVTLAGAETLGNLLRYLVRGTGMLTSNVAEACAFVRSRPELAAPDLELIFAPIQFSNHGLAPPREHGLSIGVVQLQPESRGEIRLRSRDPHAPPLIAARYLSDPEGADLRTMTAGIELARRVFAAPAFAGHVGRELQPGALSLEDCVRTRAETLYHPVGTCRMGTDALAVVDPELRVHGLDNLRVVDASVMPRIIRGHPHAPTVMIGERGADLIRLPRAARPARTDHQPRAV